MAKARTNIEIEMTYVEQIMKRYGLHTKTEAVDMALRQVAGLIPMTREEALQMEGAHAIGEIPPDTGLPDGVEWAWDDDDDVG